METLYQLLKPYFGVQSVWIAELFVIIFLVLLANYLWYVFHARLMKSLQKTVNLWDDALALALKHPVGYLILLYGIGFAIDGIEPSDASSLLTIYKPLEENGFIVLFTWFLLRFIRYGEQNAIDQHKTDPTTAHAIGKLLRISVIITALLILLQHMGYSVSGILAFGGVGGLAIGLAAKDLLANFFGGLMIYLDRPFKVGDWIRSPDRNIEGVVEDIGWRQTRIRTFDKRPLYVPNSAFSSIAVENPSRMQNRRIYETIGVRYEDAGYVSAIVDQVEQYLRHNESIDTTQTLMVNFNAFAPSSLDFFIYTFTKTTDWVEFHQIKQAVLLDIYQIIESHGAEVAYPTSTLHINAPEQAERFNQV